MPARSWLTIDDFAKEGRLLRATFDARFADPRKARADRFVWDYWHVPGQYTALRTPAEGYFPRATLSRFLERLTSFGRRRLGCHALSFTWLSCYVEGCRQELHGDLPHGPFAWVYSLTRWRGRRFTGGETLLLRDHVLDYWDGFESVRAVEERHLVRAIAPELGRLVVFDPRVPHGVRAVHGTHDPREGRLVLHGWFTEPRPFVEGALEAEEVRDAVAGIASAAAPHLEAGLAPVGLVSLGLSIDRRGAVRRVELLADTLRAPRAAEPARRRMVRAIQAAAAAARLPAAKGPSRLTLPLVFQR